MLCFYTAKADDNDSNLIHLNKYRLLSIERLNFKNFHNLYMTVFTFCSSDGENDTIIINYTTDKVLAANPIGNFICPFIVDSVYEIHIRKLCIKQLRNTPDNYYTLYMDMQFKGEDCSFLRRKKIRKVSRPPKPPFRTTIVDHNYVDIKSHLYEVIFIKCSFMSCIYR